MPLTVLLTSPFNKVLGQSVYAKVTAYNVLGEGLASSVGNGAVIFISTEPDPPINIARHEATTTTTAIGISWDAPIDHGGQPIIDYRLSYDESTGNWVDISSGISETTFTKGDLITGNTYTFRVEARNAVGYSTYSSEFSIIAAKAPAKPAIATTAVDKSNIVVDW